MGTIQSYVVISGTVRNPHVSHTEYPTTHIGHDLVFEIDKDAGNAWAMSKALKLSGAESLSVAGNIFLGQTESPFMIKAYLEKMNKSEMLLVMSGGMATLAGGVLGWTIGFIYNKMVNIREK